MLSFIKVANVPLELSSTSSSQTPIKKRSLSLRWDAFLDGKRKYLSVVGGYLINFLIGGYIAVGNVLPYLASYLTAMEMDENTTSCTEDVRSQFSANMTLCNFMLAALTIGYASFGAVGGFLSLYVSTRVIALMGGSVVVTSFFITSLYTSNVYVMMFCSFGVLYGVGAGFMWSPSILCVLRWFPQSKALLNGTLLSAVTVGSICLSIVETEHINPSNIYNDPECGYALHPEVMAKVPGTFSILAVIATICTIIGFLCLFDKNGEVSPSVSDADMIATQKITEIAGATITETAGVPVVIDVGDGGETGSKEAMRDYTVSEALRTRQFWTICGNLMLAVFTISFVYSDWKLIAQSYFLIGDDQFLLSLNMAAAICGVCGRFFWGAYYDYTASYRVTILSLASITLITVSTLPLCPAGNKVMVSIWICMLWFCVSAAYTVFPPALSDNFGDKYCGILMGFIIISETVATFSQSSVFTFFQSSGWDNDTIWTSLCLEQGLFATLSFLITAHFEQLKR